MAARRNNDLTGEIPGRTGKLKLNPPGWRVAFFIDDGEGEGFEAMKRVQKLKSGPDTYLDMDAENDAGTTKATIHVAISAFALLNAVQIAHEQRPEAKRIVVCSHDLHNTQYATFSANHPAKILMWTLRERCLNLWPGVTMQFETIKKTENKAVAVLAKHDMGNYYSSQSRAEYADKQRPRPVEDRVAPRAGVPAAVLDPRGGLDPRGVPALFTASMSAGELRSRIADVEEQLNMAKAMLSVKAARASEEESESDGNASGRKF